MYTLPTASCSASGGSTISLGGGSCSIATNGDGPRTDLALCADTLVANNVPIASAARHSTVACMLTPLGLVQIRRERVVVGFLRRVTFETRLDGIGRQRLVGIAARPGLEAPATGGCVFPRILQHHRNRLAATLREYSLDRREVPHIVHEDRAVGYGVA